MKAPLNHVVRLEGLILLAVAAIFVQVVSSAIASPSELPKNYLVEVLDEKGNFMCTGFVVKGENYRDIVYTPGHCTISNHVIWRPRRSVLTIVSRANKIITNNYVENDVWYFKDIAMSYSFLPRFTFEMQPLEVGDISEVRSEDDLLLIDGYPRSVRQAYSCKKYDVDLGYKLEGSYTIKCRDANWFGASGAPVLYKNKVVGMVFALFLLDKSVLFVVPIPK